MHPLLMTVPSEAFKQGDAALREALGGQVRTVRGWTLDVRFQFMEAQTRLIQAAAPPPTAAPNPDEVRGQTRMLVAMVGGALADGVRAEPHAIMWEGRAIPGRLYTAVQPNPDATLIVYYHFGGGVIGDLDTCNAFCSMLCAASGGPVLSVDYRLAPEHKFPAGLQDAIAGYRYGCAHAAAWGARAGVAAVGGDSMGGNFAAIVAQQAKLHGWSEPALQLLIYPATDLANDAASMTDFADAFPLTRQTMDWFMSQYVGPNDDLAHDPLLSPAAAKSLAGLAPALIYTAGFDPLVDQGDAYAARLQSDGATVKHRRFESLAHGFTAFTGGIPAAHAACEDIAQDVATWLMRR